MSISQRRGTTFMYGIADEKFVHVKRKTYKNNLIPTCVVPDCLRQQVKIDLKAISILFKATPEKLIVLAALAVDKLPLPEVYSWTSLDVARWIKNLGFPEYRETFQVNCISGNNLLLVDAKALIAMNIKNFDHIKTITAEIRCLYDMPKLKNFPKSVRTFTPYEHYKLYRHRTGNQYQNIKPSKFFWDKELLNEQPRTMTHWDKLSAWVKYEPVVKQKTVIPYLPRRNLLKCKPVKEKKNKIEEYHYSVCTCFPPCLCHWHEQKEIIDGFTCLKDEILVKPTETIDTLSCLQQLCPEHYAYETQSYDYVLKLPEKKYKTCPCKSADTEPYYSVIKLGLFDQKVTKVPFNK